MKPDIHPLTRDRWPDLVELFSRPGGDRSSAAGYCMYCRKAGPTPPGDLEANHKAMKSLVASDYVPGLIAYQDGSPKGWISLSPREDYARLKRSPVMKPVDDKPRSRGARLLEAYPIDKDNRSHPDFMFFSAKSMYDRAGFREVARRTDTRPVVRRALRPPRKKT